jgi:hypothetical protein
MTRMTILGLVALAASSVLPPHVSHAASLTDAENYTKRVSKVAPLVAADIASFRKLALRAKSFCNCRPGTMEDERRVGFLVSIPATNQAPTATCVVPTFDGAGTIVEGTFCDDWALMQK